MPRNLQTLPRVADGWTFLYAEHVRVEQDHHAITLLDQNGRVPVPVAALSTLLLGPGSIITHAAITALAENGCSLLFCGEGATRMYASGHGETYRGGNVLAQARAWADPKQHLDVVARLYRQRFSDPLPEGLSIEQIRGMEGVRVRETYAQLSRDTGVVWRGRLYKPGSWAAADGVNRALSAANACLYGLCHAAIVATGFSPALGFVHTGKMLAFVYDVADLYKCEVTVPVAFRAAADGEKDIERRVRKACREAFREHKLLERIVPDMQRALGLKPDKVRSFEHPRDDDAIGGLWDPDAGEIPGGRNHARSDQPEGSDAGTPTDADTDADDEEIS